MMKVEESATPCLELTPVVEPEEEARQFTDGQIQSEDKVIYSISYRSSEINANRWLT